MILLYSPMVQPITNIFMPSILKQLLTLIKFEEIQGNLFSFLLIVFYFYIKYVVIVIFSTSGERKTSKRRIESGERQTSKRRIE
jgi:hypothetical protein